TFLEAQRHALAFELAAIHAAAGITGLAVAATDGQLQQGLSVRRPAQHQVAVPLVPARMDLVSAAILVIVGPGAVGQQPDIALTAARRRIDVAIETPV